MSARRGETLPLGVDVGSTRIRVALCARDAAGRPTLRGVAAREPGTDPAGALADAVAELGTRERRCVIGIAHPDALLRVVTLPPMPARERRQAIRFAAARFVDFPLAEASVALRRLESPQRWLVGIARRDALEARYTVATRAKLRPLAVDDVAFSLMRVYGDADGTIDVGATTTRLTIFARVPYVTDAGLGSDALTDGIAQSLGVDAALAEERKRSIGFAGAGEAQRDALIDRIVRMLANARAAGHTDVHRLLMIGNGSRVGGLPEAVERATGCAVRLATLDGATSDTLPPDVLRAAGPDWSVAYGLTLWDAVR